MRMLVHMRSCFIKLTFWVTYLCIILLILGLIYMNSPFHYILSRKGHKQVVHCNCIHTKYSANGDKVSWRCTDYYSEWKCKVLLETVGDEIVGMRNVHNHPDHSEKIYAG